MIRFYETLSQHASPVSAFLAAQTWLKEADYHTLIPWYEQLSQLAKSQGHGCYETLDDTAAIARRTADEKGWNFQPFAHPYHWAGFTITGYEKSELSV